MSVEAYESYNLTSSYNDKQLKIWGQPCTVFIPNNLREMGYEDQKPDELKESTGVDKVGTVFTRINTRCHINFSVSKSVFYHFNWFPEDAEKLCLAYFPTNAVITAEAYVRTAQVAQTSKWGDMIFKIVDIKDDGVFQTLRRNYFLRPVSSAELNNLLQLGPSGVLKINS